MLSKVIAHRIRPLLNDSVNPVKSSFIPARTAADNIIVIQEFFHTISKSNSKKGDITVKFNLAKAYDRMDWRFLKETRRDFGFPDKYVNLVMNWVSSSFFLRHEA